jgi:DNA-directed RNA polymerase sigma subunit (sigma70/sigma32)
MGVSRERVRQIQVRAMKELLQYANEEKIELPEDDVL